MNSVSTWRTFGEQGALTRAEVTAWDDGSILITANGQPVAVDNLGAVVSAIRWRALDGVACRLVTTIPEPEVADRAEAARVEAERLAHEATEPAPVESESAVPTCAKCGATDVKLVDVPTGAVCIPCIVAGLAKP